MKWFLLLLLCSMILASCSSGEEGDASSATLPAQADSSAAVPLQKDLLRNTDFREIRSNGLPSGYGGMVENAPFVVIVNEGILTVEKTRDGDFSLMYPLQAVDLGPSQKYLFEIDIRSLDLFTSVFPEVQLIDSNGKTLGWKNSPKAVSGNMDWTHCRVEFETTEDTDRALVFLGRNYNFLNGSFSVRNPRLVRVK